MWHLHLIISDYHREGLASVLRGEFGGHRRNLRPEEEKAFLAPFLAKAEKGQILIASDVMSTVKSLRVMFQDEAGFGRINKPKRCRCPKGCRTAIPCQHIREYTIMDKAAWHTARDS